jgi:hypothetical protein
MDESRDLRAEFRPDAEEYRRVSALLLVPVILMFAFGGLLWLVPKYRAIGIAGFAACIVGSVVGALVFLPKLVCPGCQKKLEDRSGYFGQSGLGRFCPECGAAALTDALIFSRCTACGKSLTRGGQNGRSYKIRYCTWCGARLDDKGV